MTPSYPNNIKQLRQAAGLTQHKLAVKAAVSDKDIARWENGANRILDPAVRRRISAALGASIVYDVPTAPDQISGDLDRGSAASRRRPRGSRRPSGER